MATWIAVSRVPMVILVCILAVIYGWYLSLPGQQGGTTANTDELGTGTRSLQSQDSKNKNYQIEYRKVDAVSLDDTLRALFSSPETESDLAVPIVFRGAFPRGPAVESWSRGAAGLAEAARVLGVLTGVYEAQPDGHIDSDDDGGGTFRNATVLYFNDEKPLAGQVPPAVPRPREIGALPAEQVLLGGGFRENKSKDEVGQSKKRRYFYYSGKLRDTPRARDTVGPVLGFPCPRGETQPNENLWVGTRGVVARAHYDSFHNAFVQLAGRKAFLLHPPAAHPTMRLHPRAHPSYRQAQVDGYARDSDLVNTSGTTARGGDTATHHATPVPRWPADTAGAEVVLEPGDVLYLPPYHFHQVTAVAESVSANAWCDSSAYWEMDKALVQPVPIEADWPRPRIERAVSEYLRILHGRILGGHGTLSSYEAGSTNTRAKGADLDARAFYAGVTAQRHGPNAEWYTAQAARAAAPLFHCDEDDIDDRAALRREMWRGVDLIAPYFDRVSVSLREIHLANYAEDLVGFFFGNELIPAFIQQCL